MVEESILKELIKGAVDVRSKAYAPYSGYKVGAAVLSFDGSIFCGCNIENASYGLTNCAERTAIFKMVSEGQLKIKAMAIIGSGDTPAFPCGACRQVISEFADGDTEIYVLYSEDKYEVYKLKDLLPHTFKLD